MAKTLVVVESPAKAKTINKYLGRDFKVIASMGHVRDLPKSQLGVDPKSGLPISPEWRDTLNVPRDETIAFAVKYDDRPGMWMFHCHILDHADAGMMGMIHLHP